MSNKLYLECYSGISGDMMVAALLDLGASPEILNKALESLPVKGFQTKITRVLKSGLDACDFNVILDEKHENHDHDMNYLHGEHPHHHEEDNHGHHHEEGNHDHHHEEGNHDHHHEEVDHAHDNEQRGLKEIIEMIEHTEITDDAKFTAIRIFRILAKAEAKVHGVEIEQVHFHEVGAIDSIVDIIAVAVCLDNLEIDQVIVPVLYDGTGFIRCRHGIIPVPVPAVAAITSEHGLKIHITNTEGEFVTPTGAAIVAAIKTSDQLPEQFAVKKIGLGAGKRTYERPSLLRAMLLQKENVLVTEDIKSKNSDIIYKLESNIDDCSGEALGYTMDRLLEAGARDVHYIPVFMKKNRPAYQLNVICLESDISKLEQIIFEETTTIGIRRQRMERTVLDRKIMKMQTSLGEVQVKICFLQDTRRIYPEYSSVVELCKKHNKPYQFVFQLIERECYDQL